MRPKFMFIVFLAFGVGLGLGRLFQSTREREIEREAARLAARIRREREEEPVAKQQAAPQVDAPEATELPESSTSESTEDSPEASGTPTPTVVPRLGNARPIGMNGEHLRPAATPTPTDPSLSGPTITPSNRQVLQPIPLVSGQ